MPSFPSQIVNLIEETGHFHITNTTFDFDLCSLDKITVRKLQSYLETSGTSWGLGAASCHEEELWILPLICFFTWTFAVLQKRLPAGPCPGSLCLVVMVGPLYSLEPGSPHDQGSPRATQTWTACRITLEMSPVDQEYHPESLERIPQLTKTIGGKKRRPCS